MKKLNITSLYNNLHFIVIAVILGILSSRYYWLFFLLLGYLFFIAKKTNLLVIILISLLLMSISSLRYYFHPAISNSFQGIVIDKVGSASLVLTKYGKVLIYYSDNLALGDYGYFTTREYSLHNTVFDFQNDYLCHKDIYQVQKLYKFSYQDNFFVLAKVQDFFCQYIDENASECSDYLKTLILGKNMLSTNINSNSQKIGIAHLLAISGLHINLLIAMVSWLLDRLFYFKKQKNFFMVVFLVFFMLITNFQISVVRAALMSILAIAFKGSKHLFTSLDYLCMVALLYLLLCPHHLFLLSFQLSFLTSFMMITLVATFSKKQNLLFTFKASLVAFLASLPLVINTNFEINLLAIFFSPIYTVIFEIIIIPLSFLVFLIPPLSKAMTVIYNLLTLSIDFLASIDDFNFIIGKLNFWEIFLYYIFLAGVFWSLGEKGKGLFFRTLLVLYMLLIYFKPYFNPFFTVAMYDVGQGDSFLISLPFNQGNILCDCYGNLATYLKRDGIKRIDAVFITHGHDDHLNALEEVLVSYQADIYTSLYANSEKLDDIKGSHRVRLLKGGDTVYVNNICFFILGPLKYLDSENNNSLVFQFSYQKITFLFTGDMEKEEEVSLVEKWGNHLKSNVLKAAHHGSSSSSSEAFLELVQPDLILLSVGINNRYGLPNNEKIVNYGNLYRTDLDGTVYVQCKKTKLSIKKAM